MPNRNFHNKITKAVLGFDGNTVHAAMDFPAKLYGQNHRFLFHNPNKLLELLVPIIASSHTPQEWGPNAMAAILHILTDQAISNLKRDNPLVEILLKSMKVI